MHDVNHSFNLFHDILLATIDTVAPVKKKRSRLDEMCPGTVWQSKKVMIKIRDCLNWLTISLHLQPR